MSQPMISNIAWIQQNPEIVHSEIDDEVVMMSVNDGKYYGTDMIGGKIWKLLETPLRVEDLIQELLNVFDVSRTQLETEVSEFLLALKAQNLIKIQNS